MNSERAPAGCFTRWFRFKPHPIGLRYPFLPRLVTPLPRQQSKPWGASLGCPPAAWTDSAKRAQYHLGAVFANNFSNHVIALLQSYCAKVGLDPHVYEAMIRTTLDAAAAGDAKSLQTGPARRADQITLDRHMDLLPKELKSIYQALSQSIQGTLP